MQIVMTGKAGDIGSYKLAVEYMDLMKSRFSTAFIANFESLNVAEKGFDGLYQELWRLGEEAGSGLEVYHGQIPIAQETIEICELLDINPYEIETSGRIYIIKDGEDAGDGVVIGRLTSNKGRIIISKFGNRFLTKV